MKKPDWPPHQDLDGQTTQAAREAQNLPPGPGEPPTAGSIL
jgi:hypothetical protein